MNSEVVQDETEMVEHRWSPQEDHKQGFEVVGSISELFCTNSQRKTSSRLRNCVSMCLQVLWEI
jgi:hypothetical protein